MKTIPDVLRTAAGHLEAGTVNYCCSAFSWIRLLDQPPETNLGLVIEAQRLFTETYEADAVASGMDPRTARLCGWWGVRSGPETNGARIFALLFLAEAIEQGLL